MLAAIAKHERQEARKRKVAAAETPRGNIIAVRCPPDETDFCFYPAVEMDVGTKWPGQDVRIQWLDMTTPAGVKQSPKSCYFPEEKEVSARADMPRVSYACVCLASRLVSNSPIISCPWGAPVQTIDGGSVICRVRRCKPSFWLHARTVQLSVEEWSAVLAKVAKLEPLEDQGGRRPSPRPGRTGSASCSGDSSADSDDDDGEPASFLSPRERSAKRARLPPSSSSSRASAVSLPVARSSAQTPMLGPAIRFSPPASQVQPPASPSQRPSSTRAPVLYGRNRSPIPPFLLFLAHLRLLTVANVHWLSQGPSPHRSPFLQAQRSAFTKSPGGASAVALRASPARPAGNIEWSPFTKSRSGLVHSATQRPEGGRSGLTRSVAAAHSV
jgi:hypothetical protein